MWYWFTEWWGRRVVKDSSKAEVENSILLDRLVRDWVTVVGEMGCSQDSSGGRLITETWWTGWCGTGSLMVGEKGC